MSFEEWWTSYLAQGGVEHFNISADQESAKAAWSAKDSECQRLRARLEVLQAGHDAAVRKAQWQARTNAELNALQEEVRTLRASWPREAEDRVNQLLGQLAEKEAERMRLAECLRLIVMTEAAVNLAKQRSDLNTAAKHRLVNAAVGEKNRAIERAATLLRGLGA